MKLLTTLAIADNYKRSLRYGRFTPYGRDDIVVLRLGGSFVALRMTGLHSGASPQGILRVRFTPLRMTKRCYAMGDPSTTACVCMPAQDDTFFNVMSTGKHVVFGTETSQPIEKFMGFLRFTSFRSK